MMKHVVVIIFSILSSQVQAQSIPTLQPTNVKMLNFNEEGGRFYTERINRCNTLSVKIGNKIKLSASDSIFYHDVCLQIESQPEHYYDIFGAECNWYCGGSVDWIKSSSALKSTGRFSYDASNAHDFSYEHAWVEGAEGYGIGEFLEYGFVGSTPRITTIIIANGYVKSQKAWEENARVKLLKVYVNNVPHVVLALKNSRSVQTFKLSPIDNADRGNLLNALPWTMKFEIVEVYPGSKYQDTAISEIFFEGIDVH
jgi:hypothetical protein